MEVENAKTVLYETLSPLSLSTSGQSPASDQLKPYSVYRNEISLAVLKPDSHETAAPDYFSLEVGGEDSERIAAAPEPEPKTPAREAATPTLERGWFRGNCRFKSPMLQLHKEIVDFCNFLSPTPEEQAARNIAVECVFDVVKHIWPHCKVEVFGSFKTGLYLPSSDIDVVILGSGLENPQKGLVALSRALSRRGMARNIQVIGKARVPIIKFVEKRSGIAFDISFDVQNGPKAAEFIQDAVSKWPPLRPLCLILKVFLQQRELNEVYSGGVGSYALLTMLMAMLQSVHDCQASPEQNLGVLLVNFFDFYGRKLNTSDVGVSCKGAGTFFLKSNKGFANRGRPFLISIEDPQAPENDIGKNSFNYFQIRSAFAMAFRTLTNPKIIMDLGPSRSILGTIIRPDSVLLERKGGSNGEVTFNSLLPGAGEPLHQSGDQQGILCNWQVDEEELLPRGNGMVGETSHSSGKKRKASLKEKSGKKVKNKQEAGKVRQEENGSMGEKGTKKKHANGFGRHNHRAPVGFGRYNRDANGYGHYGGESSWTR
ncbi:hypothetical protein FH972_020594 [Carpinus fangiana]|uniref:polynucleotide adenylyltransferase n=1 Tax=Carpinus fangiana TaxID=176857 RepID=A0A5N6RY33_9ROSI|nr:hypothetical protein FH972_020594 [Carpinus fangiana]